jgi:hypothetical protein
MDVIKTADWITDLGPEGGHSSGRIVARGTLEKVAKQPASYTGRYLKARSLILSELCIDCNHFVQLDQGVKKIFPVKFFKMNEMIAYFL